MADDFERGGSKLYAALARSLADDPVVADIVGDHKPRWEAPLRLFGGVHYLELSGLVRHPWPKLRGVLEANRDWLTRFVAEQPVQTNEVQRCWGLLPGFLSVPDGRPLDLVELEPSGGLNLFWDRYRYRYGERGWGLQDAALELSGETEGGPPPELLDVEVEVRRRAGIDRRPVDVYHSASTVYLRDQERSRLRETLEAEATRGSLAHVSYEFMRDDDIGYEGFALEVRSWPGDWRRLALLDGHANRLEWAA